MSGRFDICFCSVWAIGVLFYTAFGSYLIWMALLLTITKHMDHKIANILSAVCLFISGCIFLIRGHAPGDS